MKYYFCIDFIAGVNEEDKIKLHAPMPSVERVKACLPLFIKMYNLNKEMELDPFLLANNFEHFFEKELKDERVDANLAPMLKEIITDLKVMENEKITGLEFYNSLSEDMRGVLENSLLFTYALWHNLKSMIPVVTENSTEVNLVAQVTCLNYTAYKSYFSKCIETIAKQSKKRKQRA